MFTKITTADSTINRIQDNIKKAFMSLDNYFSKSVLLENVHLNTGMNRINNPLGRNIKGVMVVLTTGAVDIYTVQDIMPESFININSSNDVTVNLVVF